MWDAGISDQEIPLEFLDVIRIIPSGCNYGLLIDKRKVKV